MAKYMAFAPQYYEKFECTGNNCLDNCCSNDWKILIDKETYDYYDSHEDGDFRKRVLDSIEVTEQEPFKAHIVLNEKGQCDFLGANGLCEIQLKYGHEHLSRTCRTYPRFYSLVGKELEAFMTMSCEVVAKDALFDKGLMRMDPIVVDFDGIPMAGLESERYIKSEKGIKVFWTLRSTTIGIIQNRKYKLWLRLIILGFYIQQADKLLADDQGEKIQGLSEEFLMRLDSGFYDSFDEKIQAQYEAKVLYIYTLLDEINKAHSNKDSVLSAIEEIKKGMDITVEDQKLQNVIDKFTTDTQEKITRLKSKKKRKLLLSCIEQMKDGLGIVSKEQDLQEVIDGYLVAYTEYFEPFFRNKEHIFEQYVVNLVFMQGFPFSYGRENSLYDNYVRLVMKYSMVKFLLIGMAGYHKDNFGENEVVKGISSFSRVFEHNREVIDAVIEPLETGEATTLGALCALIKD